MIGGGGGAFGILEDALTGDDTGWTAPWVRLVILFSETRRTDARVRLDGTLFSETRLVADRPFSGNFGGDRFTNGFSSSTDPDWWPDRLLVFPFLRFLLCFCERLNGLFSSRITWLGSGFSLFSMHLFNLWKQQAQNTTTKQQQQHSVNVDGLI